MSSSVLRPGAARFAMLLAASLLAGCGGTTASVVDATAPTSGPVTKAQAVGYAHVVNLQAGDLPGFTSIGSEAEAPESGRYGLEYSRCRGGISPVRRLVKIYSTEFTAGRAFYGKVMRSVVEVWPTPALAILNNTTSHGSRGRACLVRYLEAVRTKINRERKGRAQHGPFEIATVPNPLPGVSHSFLTTINETLLLRTGAIRAHVYRDIFGFISGAAEIELEAVGFGHPVPAATEEKALLRLLAHARATAI
jgi:hypothetical protein